MSRESKKVLEKVADLCNDERELEAEALLKAQLAIDPDNLELMTKLGVTQARLCNDNEAEATLRTVLIRDPNYEDAVCALGALLDQSLRTEEAEQLYRVLLQRNPASHLVLDSLCRFLVSEDRTDEALNLARNQIVNYENNLDAFKPLIYVLEILEDDLEFTLHEDWGNRTIFTQYLSNLLEQLELVFIRENFSIDDEEFHCELEDEKSRLVCEIEDLLNNAASRKISISPELTKRVTANLKIARGGG
ncbi:hypothetical protein EU528_14675 [Candidatus Thorarchaeota archaeon]|nr:MAG: hypothetical protein EU528_14675 [Candidatus Thorarchaeota archaeon]